MFSYQRLPKLPSLQLIKQAMRLHSPIGYLLLFWPCAWGLLLGRPTTIQLLWLPVFLLGAILMRGAGCIINDLTDKEFDQHVARTKSRPIAAGQITRQQALLLVAILLIASAIIWLALPYKAKVIAVVGLAMAALYPWFKRFSRCPQFFLGLTFNLGVLIGAATICYASVSLWYLYAAAVAWTVGYDTIYALQDREDDIKVGIKSFAVTLGEDVAYGVTNCYKLATILFLITGLVRGAGWLYFVGLIAAGALLKLQVDSLGAADNAEPNYQQIFIRNNLVGAVIALAIWLG